MAYQYLRLAQYDKVIEKYELLLNLDGRYLLTYYTLSNAYRLNGRLRLALSYQERLLEMLDDPQIVSLAPNAACGFSHRSVRYRKTL